jgi:transposase
MTLSATEKRKELSDFEKGQIIGLHQHTDYSLGEIGRRLGIPKSTVASIITRWKNRGTVVNKVRTGRPEKLP